jgi:beta-glucanase (GH16 family)
MISGAHGSAGSRSSPAQLVWSEDFEGRSGASPDPSRWVHDVGGHGWGNQELQYYTASRRNVALDGAGHLVITARADSSGQQCWYGPCRYTSARLTTAGRFSMLYGRVEARMKLPNGRGIWPAFWMLGNNCPEVGWPACGEIDIMEHLGHETGTVHGALHAPGLDKVVTYDLPAGSSLTSDFHTFAVEWRTDEVRWLVDDRVYAVEHIGRAGRPGNVFGREFHLLLNVAVGGTWPGSPDSTTVLPQRLVVDWVRAYRFSGSDVDG